MPSLRLLADDLTGALDTSAELVGAFGPFDIYWSLDQVPAGAVSLAFDSGSRELDAVQAAARVRQSAPLLGGAAIAFKKMDSLLRGPWAAEIAMCLEAGPWEACIVAPAFVHQGRRTRAGRQYALAPDGNWNAVGSDPSHEVETSFPEQDDVQGRSLRRVLTSS